MLTFERGVGDAIITYENEMLVGRAGGRDYEYITAGSTILIENPIAIIDANVDRHGTRELTQAFIDFLPTPAIDVRLKVGATRFLFWPRFAYSYSGPTGDLSARYRFDRRHSVSLFGSFNPRTYNGNVNPRPEEAETPVLRRFGVKVLPWLVAAFGIACAAAVSGN